MLQRIKSAAEPRGGWDGRRRGTHIPAPNTTYRFVPSHSLLSTIVSFPSVICKSVILSTILIFPKPHFSQTVNLKPWFYRNFGAGNELCLNCILLQDDSFYRQVLQLREGELLRETGKLSQRKGIGKSERLWGTAQHKSYLPVLLFFGFLFVFFLICTTKKGCKLLCNLSGRLKERTLKSTSIFLKVYFHIFSKICFALNLCTGDQKRK